MTLSARGPAGSQYLGSSVAVNTETKRPFWKGKVHINSTLGTNHDSGKKLMLPKAEWKENSLLEVVTSEILH